MPKVKYMEEGRCPICGFHGVKEEKEKLWNVTGFDIPFSCGNCGFKGQYSFQVKLDTILDENGFPVED